MAAAATMTRTKRKRKCVTGTETDVMELHTPREFLSALVQWSDGRFPPEVLGIVRDYCAATLMRFNIETVKSDHRSQSLQITCFGPDLPPGGIYSPVFTIPLHAGGSRVTADFFGKHLLVVWGMAVRRISISGQCKVSPNIPIPVEERYQLHGALTRLGEAVFLNIQTHTAYITVGDMQEWKTVSVAGMPSGWSFSSLISSCWGDETKLYLCERIPLLGGGLRVGYLDTDDCAWHPLPALEETKKSRECKAHTRVIFLRERSLVSFAPPCDEEAAVLGPGQTSWKTMTIQSAQLGIGGRFEAQLCWRDGSLWRIVFSDDGRSLRCQRVAPWKPPDDDGIPVLDAHYSLRPHPAAERRQSLRSSSSSLSSSSSSSSSETRGPNSRKNKNKKPKL